MTCINSLDWPILTIISFRIVLNCVTATEQFTFNLQKIIQWTVQAITAFHGSKQALAQATLLFHPKLDA